MTVSEEGLFSASDVEVGLTGRPIRELPEPAPLEKHGPATIISCLLYTSDAADDTINV